MPALKTCVLVPQYQHISENSARNLARLAEIGFPILKIVGNASIDLARSELATRALAADYERFLWLDSDIDYNFTHIEKLLSSKEPFVCAAYALPKLNKLSVKTTESISFGAEGKLVEVLACGFGFVLTHRSVFEKMDVPVCVPCTPYFQPMIAIDETSRKLTYYSEDYSFCLRAREAGFKVMCDTSIIIGHSAPKVYTVLDLK